MCLLVGYTISGVAVVDLVIDRNNKQLVMD